MVSIADLWLPILLSSVFVFVVSSILHMVLPHHKSDCNKLPGEDQILETMRAQNVRPGEYAFPHPGSMKEMGSPEMAARYNQGPVGMMAVLPSRPPQIGKSLAQWFVYLLIVGIFAGYIGSLAVAAGAEYTRVFRVTGTAAILAYCVGNIPASIWKGQQWSVTVKFMVDGVIYGLVTAGTFGWLWPAAA